MVGEKLGSYLSESIENSSGKTEESDYPPFDPDKAKKLIANVKMLSSAEEISDENLRQKVLNREEEIRERKEKDDASFGEYDFRNADRYQEDTFLLAAANSLVDSPDIGFIDNVMFDAKKRASKDGVTEFEALKQFVRESDIDKSGGWAATDLMNAFIDTTSTYIISKDEKIGRGFAKGLLTSLEMQIDGDKPSPHIDALRVDLSIIKPLADEFINGYNASYDSPSAFSDYLRSELEMREIDMRGVKRRGEQISTDMERETQAIKTAITRLEEMRSNYDKNLKNLHDTAYANHRVIR